MPRTIKNPETSPVFTETRDFIARYSAIDEHYLNVAAVWVMGTWCFSPSTTWPATFPYLYVTGAAGSGKTVLCQDALGSLVRNFTIATGTTGATLFRMLGTENEETGEIENHAPTLFLDEIDATYAGNKDESHRLSLNVGYKMGGSIPRSSGKTAIQFPVYGPKMLAGIDNGHLPETVAQRSIRINVERRTADELAAAGIQEFYVFETEDEAAEIQQRLSTWAKVNSSVLREYKPARPAGLSARQWEITRSLVQLAHAIGNEAEIVQSLAVVMERHAPAQDAKITLYQAILSLFTDLDTDRLTTNQILGRLRAENVQVPGNNGKGLGAMLAKDGAKGRVIRFPDGTPGVRPEVGTARGYFRYEFDQPFAKYLGVSADDDQC